MSTEVLTFDAIAILQTYLPLHSIREKIVAKENCPIFDIWTEYNSFPAALVPCLMTSVPLHFGQCKGSKITAVET